MGKEKLFCFPYAGGSSTLYEGSLCGLKEAFDMIALDYSGHGTKYGLPLYETMEEMTSELYKEVTEKLSKDEDYYLFGYSLGSIVAYQIACRLSDNGYRLPKKLFLCSMEAPHKIPENEWIHKLSEEDFRNEMISMGGIDDELLKDPLMLKIFMPIIRRDFKLHEEFEGEKHDVLDTCALVFYSDEDISNENIRNWDTVIGSVQYLCYPGGHFFIYDKYDEVVKEVIKRK
ncbi:MAG: thioesterase [Oribacterium sp.]|nr:thioesterase [Oribacterium sp.]